MELTC